MIYKAPTSIKNQGTVTTLIALHQAYISSNLQLKLSSQYRPLKS